MENRQLVYNQQHEKGNRSFNVEVYKGKGYRNGKAEFRGRKYEQVVLIKTFSIMVRETITDAQGKQSFHTEWFMNCTSRAGEFKTVLDIMKSDCKNMNDILYLMTEMEKYFSVALDQDAKNAVRKALGLFERKPVYDITGANKNVAKRLPNPFLLK